MVRRELCRRSFAFGLAVTCLMAVVFSYGQLGCEAITILKFLVGNTAPETLNPVINAFEKENPDIRIQPQYVAWNETDDKFLTMVAGGTPPDLFSANSVYGWARYAYEGLLLDLRSYVERDKEELKIDDTWPAAWRNATVGGRLSGTPGVGIGMCVIYNATLLEEAGLELPPTDWEDNAWNWDRMISYAKKLTKVGADNKATQFGVDFWDADSLIQFSWAFGGDWFDKDSYKTGIVNKVTLSTPQNVRAYGAVADLRMKHMVRPGGPLVAATPIGGVNSLWAGKLGMWVDPGFLPDPMKTPAAKEFSWGLAPFPYPPDGPRDRAFTWAGAGIGIPAGSKHPEEAWKFLKYLMSDKDEPSLRTFAGPGARKSLWYGYVKKWLGYKISALPERRLLQFVIGGLERSVGIPRCTMVGASDVWNSLQKELAPALRGQTSVDAALQKAQKVAEEAVKKLKAQIKK